jgi:hypothetical protein
LFFCIKEKILRNKIKLEIKDTRLSYSSKKSTPYILFIEYGENSFYFTNEKKAKKWLCNFERVATNLLKELLSHLPNLYQNNIVLTPYLEYSTLRNFTSSLFEIQKRYYHLFHRTDVRIGREINNIYYEIEEQYQFYRGFYQKNNRFNYLYQKTRQNIKSLKRLRQEFDYLLTEINGIKKTQTSAPIKMTSFLKIA